SVPVGVGDPTRPSRRNVSYVFLLADKHARRRSGLRFRYPLLSPAYAGSVLEYAENQGTRTSYETNRFIAHDLANLAPSLNQADGATVLTSGATRVRPSHPHTEATNATLRNPAAHRRAGERIDPRIIDSPGD